MVCTRPMARVQYSLNFVFPSTGDTPRIAWARGEAKTTSSMKCVSMASTSLRFHSETQRSAKSRESACVRNVSPYSQNFVTSVKLKSRTFIAGTTISNDSSPAARTGILVLSTLDSM